YFQMRGQGSTQQFVQAIYHDVLGRSADSQGLTAWSQAAANPANRVNVAFNILLSAEGCDNLVMGWYLRFLRRPSANQEENGWISALQNGSGELPALANFLGSAEYFTVAQG